MTAEERIDTGSFDERTLLTKQCLRYAEDLVRIYEEERATRRELERVKKRLVAEIADRHRVEEALLKGVAR
ncbi:MAG: hypothetical protein HY914_14425 [Desulfomonile tiedjei]|nr:hypothetical protein [Desulfomonile tiedjei]